MSVRINSSFNPGGMPTLEYSIIINGIAISLKKEDFNSLVTKLGKEISNDLKKATEVKEKFWSNVKKLQELRKDIISVFWEGMEGDEYFLKRSLNEIDEDKLFEVLEKYNRFLGFE